MTPLLFVFQIKTGSWISRWQPCDILLAVLAFHTLYISTRAEQAWFLCIGARLSVSVMAAVGLCFILKTGMHRYGGRTGSTWLHFLFWWRQLLSILILAPIYQDKVHIFETLPSNKHNFVSENLQCILFEETGWLLVTLFCWVGF